MTMRFVGVVLAGLVGCGSTSVPLGGDWRTVHDFDGDGAPDVVHVAYSGGAHCCYTLRINTADAEHSLPYELDGGYLAGLDTSKPERFNVVDRTGDGLVDLCMDVGTYNGRNGREVMTNRVVVSLAEGVVSVHDYDGPCS